jgi:hypothetical protein
MTTIPMLVAMLVAQDPSLVSANAGRPSICVTASADSEPAAEVKNLADSAKDLERALRSLERKHQFAVAAPGGSCGIKLLVQRRIEDEEKETYTVVVRLTSATSESPSHTEEVTATEGSWRGAASTVAGKVASFVDSNRPAVAGGRPSGAPTTSAPASSAPPATVPATRASSSTPPPPAPPPLPGATAPATSSSARTSTGGRTIEDGILDWVRLHGEGSHTMQTPIYMRLFSTDKANLGTGGDGGKETRASEAKTLQGQGPALLRETFLARASATGVSAHVYDDAGAIPPAAIVVEGEFVTIDPGSRTKRYLVGFGAGKSAIEIAGRFLTATGEVLAEFRHRRIGAMGMGGGDSLGKLLSDTKSCGEDIAKFAAAWLANKPLK